MPKVKVKNDNFEAAFRKFKRTVEKAGVIKEIRKREYYEKPSSIRKRAKQAAVKRTHRERSEDINIHRKRLY